MLQQAKRFLDHLLRKGECRFEELSVYERSIRRTEVKKTWSMVLEVGTVPIDSQAAIEQGVT